MGILSLAMFDRQDFFETMSGALAAPPGAALVGGRVPVGRVKTRILEAHAPEPSSAGVATLLTGLSTRLGLNATQVGDELWWLEGDTVVAFLDTLNPRFWQLHSTSRASEVARLVRALVAQDARLDTAWLPKHLLKQLEGDHVWVKSAFESDDLLGVDTRARRWRARFEGQAPDGLLQLLEKSEYVQAATLTGVGSRVSEPDVGSAVIVADYRGAFLTGQGDFSVAASAVWNLLCRYEQWIIELEERHRLSSYQLAGGGFVIDGDVATLKFGQEVDDLDRLVRGLFNAKEPFRLWGVPERVGGGWYADAVDLHVGHPFRIDVLRDRVRVLLEPETCGNTLARLLTNLQQRLDARTHLV